MKSPAGIDWLAWWQLLRAANVFTAMSNVIAGFLLVQQEWQPLGPLVLLILSSVCLYEAGMVLNDVFDAELDAAERPERPIPSGSVSTNSAMVLAILLLLGGLTLTGIVSWITNSYHSLLVAASLGAMIISYDFSLKSTSFGPYAMGACRALNVLLGASIATSLSPGVTGAIFFAWGVLFHTSGLTFIARSEAGTIRFSELALGSGIAMTCLVWIAGLPVFFEEPEIPLIGWMTICILLLVSELIIFARLLRNPGENTIRHTVGLLIMLFIPIDAAASAVAAGWPAGLGVLSLLVPVHMLSRWTGQT